MIKNWLRNWLLSDVQDEHKALWNQTAELREIICNLLPANKELMCCNFESPYFNSVEGYPVNERRIVGIYDKDIKDIQLLSCILQDYKGLSESLLKRRCFPITEENNDPFGVIQIKRSEV